MQMTSLGNFGIELPADVLSPDMADQLPQLLARHKLILIRGLNLDAAQQREFANLFGRVIPADEDPPVVSTKPERGVFGSGALAFHSDQSFCREPIEAISLHAIEVSEGACATLFADGAGAYRRLPEDLKRRIEPLSARHALAVDLAIANRRKPDDHRWPETVHPLIMRHPLTDEPILYVTQQQTFPIVGLSDAESEELLETLFDYLYDPAEVLEHVWSNGDLVIWDNLALQHGRRPNPAGVRTLQRVCVGKSFKDHYPDYRDVFYQYSEEIRREGRIVSLS